MQLSYKTCGTCAKRIDIEIEAGMIVSASFIDGCGGNTQTVAVLVKGMAVSEAVRRLKGIACELAGKRQGEVYLAALLRSAVDPN